MITEIYKYLFRKSATLLNRSQLGSIDFSDTKLTEMQKVERNAKIAADYKLLSRIVEDFLKEQKDFIANQCENESQLLFSRGTVNGISLLGEAFTSFKGQHDEITKPKENYNPNKIF